MLHNTRMSSKVSQAHCEQWGWVGSRKKWDGRLFGFMVINSAWMRQTCNSVKGEGGSRRIKKRFDHRWIQDSKEVSDLTDQLLLVRIKPPKSRSRSFGAGYSTPDGACHLFINVRAFCRSLNIMRGLGKGKKKAEMLIKVREGKICIVEVNHVIWLDRGDCKRKECKKQKQKKMKNNNRIQGKQDSGCFFFSSFFPSLREK